MVCVLIGSIDEDSLGSHKDALQELADESTFVSLLTYYHVCWGGSYIISNFSLFVQGCQTENSCFLCAVRKVLATNSRIKPLLV